MCDAITCSVTKMTKSLNTFASNVAFWSVELLMSINRHINALKFIKVHMKVS